MASVCGNFQRPLVATAAVVVASLAPDKLPSHQLLETCSTTSNSLKKPNFLWVSHISASKLTYLTFKTRIRVSLPATSTNFFVPNSVAKLVPNLLGSFVGASSSLFLNSYQSAQLANGLRKPATFAKISASPPDVLYTWHLPSPDAIDVSGSSDCKSRTVVVLLGWLGSKQKHLKKYADWYTGRGFHVITFTFPMSEVLSYQVGGKAEQDIDLLVNHLADWLEEEHGKHLLFHTFSNTGWLTYGVILEKFQQQDPSLMGKIKGCIVDSAPAASPDPKVWASGFSAAFLKKNSVATKMHLNSNDSNVELSVGRKTSVEPKPAATEAALLVILEKFFGVVLNLPTVNRRLSDVLNLLSSRQPNCPQLYMYSSADRVIPAKSVESFIEEQRRAGHEVRAYDFVWTPHVDHFRNDPKLYGTQLSRFLDDCVLTSGKHT